MSSDPVRAGDAARGGDPAGGGQPGGARPMEHQPIEEELRAAYEAELSRITSSDMMLQAAVSLLNIGGHRLGPGGGGGPSEPADVSGPAGSERDLEQVRDAIDAVSALLEILGRRHSQELRPLKDALSQLQIAYAREVQATASAPDASAGGSAREGAGSAGAQTGEQGEGGDEQARARRPGPAEASGRLWVPGG